MKAVPFTTTQQVRMQKDLELSHERFRIVVEQTGQLVYDYDLETGHIEWDGAVEAITGYSHAEFQKVGIKDWEDKIHPEDRMRALALLADALDSTSAYQVKYRFRRRDGSYIHVEDHGVFHTHRESNRVRMMGVMSDITERVNAENALIRSEELYRSLVEAFSHMVWMADAEGRTTMDLKAWAEFTGQNDGEKAGYGWAEAVHPEDLPGMMQKWKQSLDSGTNYQHEYRLRRKDGVYRVMAAKAVPVRDSQSRIHTWIGTCEDVTEQREARRKQEFLEAQLRQAQKMEAIGTMAGGIAHDFNNILTAIISYAELAESEAQGNRVQQENMAHILQAADRASDLVKQILSFSRQNKNETKVLRLPALIAESMKLLKAGLPAQAELEVDYGRDIPCIMGDSTQIQQVILNLCTNAAQALSGDAGKIEVGLQRLDSSRKSSHPKPMDLMEGDCVVLSVSDNGVGMDEETTKRIFDPFFTTKAPGEGTGLGLSVVHGIMQAHGGRIEVESALGRGTRFRLYFPAVTELQNEPAGVTEEFTPGMGQRILLVDDEVKICRALSRILQRLGYVTDYRIRPLEALTLFEENPDLWDVLITDLTMPGLTGIQLAEKIHKVRPDLPVLLVTGYSGTLTREQLQEKGILELIQKPMTAQTLAVALSKALEKTRSN
ncbi:MAG: PAS domain-containing protein [Blastochloris sp.]|nr:PAS domain-containing protein [Blastochloris sp.]